MVTQDDYEMTEEELYEFIAKLPEFLQQLEEEYRHSLEKQSETTWS